jgi:Flp pilus assembly protein TadG
MASGTGLEKHLENRSHRPRGTVMIYSVIVMTVMLAFAVLAVDLGRISLARSQLQDAADAAARYAVAGMVSSSTYQTTAQSHAAAALADCTVEGVALSASNLTTTIGVWNSNGNVFTPAATTPNAVKVELTFRFTTGSGRVPLFVQALTTQQPLIHASAIAKASSREDTFSPPAAGNLWLSGMTAGTQTQNFRPDANWVWDYAGTTSTPRQSPLALTLSSIGLQAGDSLTF